MCLKTIDFFDACGHNTKRNPNVAAYCDIQKCSDWDPVELNCPRLNTQDHHHNAKCPCCSERLKEVGFWYKHCYQAQVCDHEYDHMETNLQRLTSEPDIVLVTPQPGVLCPDCGQAGYDNRPGGRNLAPRTASIMPVEFENLPRAEISQVQRVSQVPATILRSMSPSKAGTSRIPSSAYNPGASRVHTQALSRATVYGSQAGSELISQALSRALSEFWSSSKAPSSQNERESSRAFEPQPSKLATASQSSSSKAPSKAPSVTQNPSSTTSKSVTSIYRPTTLAPHIYNPIKAPLADEEGPDLDEILSKASTTISEPLSPPGGTGYSGVPSIYKPSVSRRPEAASKSKAPVAASEATIEGSGQSQISSQSKVRHQSSVERSETSRMSKGLDSIAGSSSTQSSYTSRSRQPPTASKKPVVLLPSELLKRGPPKNVNSSAFYENPDEEEARTRAEGWQSRAR